MMNTRDILETITMIDDENLDVRTITMGISLLDCIGGGIESTCDHIYDKICRYAGDLVKTGEDISKEYGIPIIHKRISVTPVSLIAAAHQAQNPVKMAKALERAAQSTGVNFLGGYSALVQKGFGPGDYALIESIPEALDVTEHVCSSVNIGSTKVSINMDAVEKMGKIIRETAERTADRDCIGAAKLVVFCNAPEDNPFMAGAFHGVGEPDCVVNVGVSGPGVVRAALAKAGTGCDITEIANIIKRPPLKSPGWASWSPRRLPAGFACPMALSIFPWPPLRHWRLRGAYSGGNGFGNLRRSRHHRLSGPAQRRCEKGRRNGLLTRRRPFRRFYSGH